MNAQLHGVLTGDGVRRMLEGKNRSAVGTVFLIVASFIDRNAGSEAHCDLTRVNGQYIDTINKVLVDHGDMQ